LLSVGNIAEYSDMPAWQVICLRCVFDEDRLAGFPDELRLTVFVSAIEKSPPGILELAPPRMESSNRLPDEFFAPHPEQSLCGRVRFEADSLIIEDYNAIERIVEDGLKLAFRSIKRARSLTVFATRQKQKSNM
jgi:hypothetical protein